MKSIANQQYPQGGPSDEEAEAEMKVLKSIITDIRKSRSASRIPPKQIVEAEYVATGRTLEIAKSNAKAIESMTKTKLKFIDERKIDDAL